MAYTTTTMVDIENTEKLLDENGHRQPRHDFSQQDVQELVAAIKTCRQLQALNWSCTSTPFVVANTRVARQMLIFVC